MKICLSVSIKAKFWHYQSVVRVICYTQQECLSLNIEKLVQDFLNIEKIVLKAISRVQKDGKEIYKLRPTSELYLIQGTKKLKDTIRKRRIKYFSLLFRMNDDWLRKC